MGTRKSEIHMHSTHSDGEFTPEGLVQIARRNGVGILALTDHDTFSGIPEFLEAAQKEDIVAFPGIEITVSYHDFNLHLLSYFKSLDSIQPELARRVETMKQAREERMHELIALINGVVPKRFQGSILFDKHAFFEPAFPGAGGPPARCPHAAGAPEARGYPRAPTSRHGSESGFAR